MMIGIVQQSNNIIGGGELALFELITVIKELNHECFVILPKDGEITRRLEKENIPYVSYPFREWVVEPGISRLTGSPQRRISYLFMEGNLVANQIKLKGLTPDLIITNTITTPVGAFAALALALPHIWYIREFGVKDFNLEYELPEKIIYKIINKLSDCCITDTYAVKSHLIKMGVKDNKINKIHEWVDVPRSVSKIKLPGRKAKMTFIITGRIEPGKRQFDAVEAMRILIHEEGLNVKLIIMGRVMNEWPESVEYFEKIKAYVIRHNLSSRVIYVGYTKNPFRYIKSSNVALMCSLNEAFGRVTIESMKLGVPVIGTSTGGTPEIMNLVTEGHEDIFLYKPGNIKDLAKIMKWTYNNKKRLDLITVDIKRYSNILFNKDCFESRINRSLEEVI